MIFITGDIHGDPRRFNVESFYEQKEMLNHEENYVIILGDFGLIWDRDGENKYEKYWLDWLENKPFTTLFIDGNHESFDRLYTYPVKEWHGGKVHEIRPHVLHLMRGEVFTIEDKKFFAFGGASSHDIQDGILDPDDYDTYDEFREVWKQWDNEYRMFRVKGYTWWPQELPTEEEMQNGWDNLKKHDNKVDFILSHCGVASTVALIGQGLFEQDILTKYLENIRSKINYAHWFMGHYHINKQISNKDIIIYEQIIRIV